MDGAEQRAAGGRQRHEVILPGGPGRRLLGRLRDPGGQRRPRDGLGEPGDRGRLCGPRPQQTGHQRLVEGVDGGERLVEPLDRIGQQIAAHQATALVGGNHCISGNGDVTGTSSR
ncbi:hypothetical protein SBADM41S_10790 [Streptomyces badius]